MEGLTENYLITGKYHISNMKVIYGPEFEISDYALDPAASKGRIDCIRKELENMEELDLIEPALATEKQLKRI